MLTRLLTGLVGTPLAILIVAWGAPVIDLGGLVIGLIGMYEFYRVMSKKYNPIIPIGYGAVAIYLLFLDWSYQYFALYSVVLMLILFITMVLRYPKYNIVDIALTFIGPVYVAVLLGFIILIRKMPMGEFFVWFTFISSWGSDTFAYFAGRYFGKHKLAPVLSPKKTIEGAIGGVIGAALLGVIYTLAYARYDVQVASINLVVLTVIIISAAILSMIGDLTASAIKRFFEEKDYGVLFPGHGGVLDRFDSVLFVAPFLYFVFSML